VLLHTELQHVIVRRVIECVVVTGKQYKP